MFNIEKYLNKPFEYGGDGTTGYDCWTLSKAILKDENIILPEWESIVDVHARSFRISHIKGINFSTLIKPEPFCIVLFILKPPYITHMGVILEDCSRFVHIMQHRRVVVERLDNIIWKPRIEGYYKYEGNSNQSK